MAFHAGLESFGAATSDISDKRPRPNPRFGVFGLLMTLSDLGMIVLY